MDPDVSPDELTRMRAELDRLRRLEALDALLPALSSVLDVREVFPRVSEILQPVLPHDALGLGLVSPDRQHIRLFAHNLPALPFEVPDEIPIPDPSMVHRDWDFLVVERIGDSEEELALHPPRRFGIRSYIRVPLREEGRLIGGMQVMCFQPRRFSPVDVAVARRVADLVLLALTHHRLAEEARRTAEAQERARLLEGRVEGLVEELRSRERPSRIVGVSPPWTDVLAQAAKVAPTETTVLLTGESGTGKEVVARILHAASGRARGTFVPLNCAALPDTLLESELFGYERGAFTGAAAAKPGRIELAQGGTLFLDEVGETSAAVQAKLLRVLQEREFQRLGATRTQKADIRVVAATNRDLRAAMERGTFREDLFYRLAVFEIRLPPLRERSEDILLLAGSFLEEIGREIGRPAAGISRDARRLLLDYPWPGNVRELRNVLERASILCDGGLISHEHLAISAPGREPGGNATGAEPRPGLRRAGASSPGPASAPPHDLASIEREAVEKALREARFNKSRAARSLGLTRGQLYGRLRRLGIE